MKKKNQQNTISINASINLISKINLHSLTFRNATWREKNKNNKSTWYTLPLLLPPHHETMNKNFSCGKRQPILSIIRITICSVQYYIHPIAAIYQNYNRKTNELKLCYLIEEKKKNTFHNLF